MRKYSRQCARGIVQHASKPASIMTDRGSQFYASAGGKGRGTSAFEKKLGHCGNLCTSFQVFPFYVVHEMGSGLRTFRLIAREFLRVAIRVVKDRKRSTLRPKPALKAIWQARGLRAPCPLRGCTARSSSLNFWRIGFSSSSEYSCALPYLLVGFRIPNCMKSSQIL